MFTIKDETGHSHKVNIDGAGNGETQMTDKGVPHTHEIIDFIVQEKLDHTHELDKDVIKTTSIYKEGDPPKVTHEDNSPSLSERFQQTININVSVNDDKSERTSDDAGRDRLPRGQSSSKESGNNSTEVEDSSSSK